MMLGWIKSKLRKATQDGKREPRLHDYRTPRWGRSLEYQVNKTDRNTLNAVGWGHGIMQGDYILLAHSGGEGRYQFESVKYLSNPSDMWSAVLVFAPRTAVAQKGGA